MLLDRNLEATVAACSSAHRPAVLHGQNNFRGRGWLGGELAARSRDLDAALDAHRAGDAVIEQHLLECIDPAAMGTFKRRSGHRVPRNEVDMAKLVRDKLGQLSC